MTGQRWRIHTTPDDLVEGLFGQVLLWTFELLPSLAERGIQPEWDIRSRLYGTAPNFRVLPGVFEVATPPPSVIDRDVSLLALRTHAVSALGGDWRAVHDLWHRYFRVPARILQRADDHALPATTLGVHYRGTDKNLSSLDTNPVAIGDLIELVGEFVETHPDVTTLFIATDDFAFVQAAQRRFPNLAVLNLGAVAFHKANTDQPGKADRALLDCVLLSRCRYLLKCSSALSGFSKVLNPDLACYRVAACKMFRDVPYFPDAYIPRYEGRGDRTRAILKRQFEGDWLDDATVASRFREVFSSQPRYTARMVLVNRVKYWVSLLQGKPRKA